MTQEAPLLLVGCGRMGGALLNGWLDSGYGAGSVVVVEPDDVAYARAEVPEGVRRCASPHDLSGAFEPRAVIVAVKPQMMDEVIPSYRRFAEAGAVFLSVAAGKTIDYFEDALGRRTAVVRAMPNTPAAIGRGITAAIGNAFVLGEQRELCDSLLAAVGKVVWLHEEEQMDAVTAVSGSGPAYVFHLVEALAAAGAAAGLPEELALQLARETVSGSGELLRRSTDSAGQLRQNVTSPAGTTAAALAILMGPQGLTELMTRAVAAATERSRQLSQ
jgi:pyrroline-5-carboxylate reductase